MLDTDDWYTPTDGTAAPRPLDPTPDRLFLRVERETIRTVPASNAVLFTIRTYVTPIPEVAADRRDRRLGSPTRSPGCPPEVQAYKDVASFGRSLIDHLRQPIMDGRDAWSRDSTRVSPKRTDPYAMLIQL